MEAMDSRPRRTPARLLRLVLAGAALTAWAGCAAHREADPQVSRSSHDAGEAYAAGESPGAGPAAVGPDAPSRRPAAMGEAVAASYEALPSGGPNPVNSAHFVAGDTIPSGRPAALPAAGSRGVLHATDATFPDLVLQAGMPVLVDFCATWCGPCRAMGPVVAELAAETPQVLVVKVDVDECPQTAAHYKATSLPSLLVFKAGRVTARQVGMINKARLKALLEQ